MILGTYLNQNEIRTRLGQRERHVLPDPPRRAATPVESADILVLKRVWDGTDVMSAVRPSSENKEERNALVDMVDGAKTEMGKDKVGNYFQVGLAIEAIQEFHTGAPVRFSVRICGPDTATGPSGISNPDMDGENIFSSSLEFHSDPAVTGPGRIIFAPRLARGAGPGPSDSPKS
jgi:hypothetical protein